MVQSDFKSFIRKAEPNGLSYSASEEAKICLNCPLPVNKCHPLVCKRYKAERKKIEEQKK